MDDKLHKVLNQLELARDAFTYRMDKEPNSERVGHIKNQIAGIKYAIGLINDQIIVTESGDKTKEG